MSEEIISMHKWMKDMSEMFFRNDEENKLTPILIKHIPLNKLHFIGSHNSGTSQIQLLPAPDCLSHVSLICKVDKTDYVATFIENWCNTQGEGVKTQLENGVRMIDLRIAKKVNEFYVCHSFFCVKLLEIISQTLEFLKENPFEVILIDLQHFYGNFDHNEFFEDIILKHFKKLIYIPTNEIPSLAKCWEKKNQILLIYESKFYKLLNKKNKKYVYERDKFIRSKWHDKQKIIDLKNSIKKEINNFKSYQNCFHVLQCIITGSNYQILREFFFEKWTGLKTVGKDCSKEFEKIFLGEWKDICDFNIILIDFCCYCKELIRFIVMKNIHKS